MPKCPRGHELTDDNLRRRRTGERSGRECLECYRSAARERSRRRYAANRDSIDRARILRARANLLGLTMTVQGTTSTLRNEHGDAVFVGTVELADVWVSERFVRRTPGPDTYAVPSRWWPWIDLLVTELRAAKRAESTIDLRVARLIAYARGNRGSDPLTVTRANLVKYMASNPDWSPEYAHSVRTSFRVFFGLLADLEFRPDDPARRLPRIKIPRALPRPCPDGAIRAALDAESADPRARLAIRIGAETGLRRMEIAALRRDAVEGWPGEFRIRLRGKGGHERIVPITDNLAKELRNGETVHVFPGPFGGHLTPGRIGEIVTEALPESWTTHTLRHRFGTVTYRGTGDIRVVQELMGHASPATTAIYAKVGDESMRRAALMADLTSAASPPPNTRCSTLGDCEH